MADLRWVAHYTQDWVDYANEDSILLGSISPLKLDGVRACTYRPSSGWPLLYDKYRDFLTEEAARAWVEHEIETRTRVGSDQPSIPLGSAEPS